MATTTRERRKAAANQPARNVAISSIKLTNLLSFKEAELELRPLNILVGANASGKSNFLDAISLLQAAGRGEVQEHLIGKSGSIAEWIWQGEQNSRAWIDTLLPYSYEEVPLDPVRFWLTFGEDDKHRGVAEYAVEDASRFGSRHSFLDVASRAAANIPALYDFHSRAAGTLSNWVGPMVDENYRDEMNRETVYVNDLFRSFRLYRDWSLGRNADVRNIKPISASGDTALLAEDASNLAAVYNNLSKDRSFRAQVRRYLNEFKEGRNDVRVQVLGGEFLRLMLKEDEHLIPATRLSDGTLHWLALLAVLLQSPPAAAPPRLICLEEPETGLHPDTIGPLARMLKEAAQHTQIIVTTHSRQLVDYFTDTPEDVVVFDKEDGATKMRRLDREELKVWLDSDYDLGEIWARNGFGGNRL